MTKADLINAVAKAAKVSKRAAGNAVDVTFSSLVKSIKKDKRFQVSGFGTFTVRSRKARKGRILKPERSSISKRAGLLDLSRHRPSKKGFRIKGSFPPRINAG